MIRVSFEELYETIYAALLNAGMNPETATVCAKTHSRSSCDGIPSHGLNRVPLFIEYLRKGWVDPQATPVLTKSLGALEQYDGRLGPGITNALFAVNRGMELARQFGLGLVALANTTHWMRGGAYGRHAAEQGFASISWTNTEPTIPVWGAKSSGVGNNPIVLAVPRPGGPLVLDMAMSLYAWGKIAVTRMKGERLPFPGGYDRDGRLTDDPAAIEDSRRALPIGYWKGSGMAVMLDVMAALLSGGKPGYAMDAVRDGSCTGCCQIFMVFDPEHFCGKTYAEELAAQMIAHIHASEPAEKGGAVRYPGEGVLITREENERLGIPVDETVWNTVRSLAGKA